MTRSPQDQLVHFLSDMYSVEQQALAQLVSAPDIAGEIGLATAFREHDLETRQQADLVQARLEAHGGSPSAVKDAIMRLGGKSFLLFARVQPETPGRLVVHAYSYESMEWAGYQMLIGFANLADDAETEQVARSIAAQERAMMARLEHGFDAAEQLTHRSLSSEKVREHVAKHLMEAHAFESQGIQLVKKSENIAGHPSLRQYCAQQLTEHQQHAQTVEQRLDAIGSAPSTWRDGALALGGLNWGFFFQAQTDTPAKLAAFLYAVLHLEIGAYELLARTAARANDSATKELCEGIVREKRATAAGWTDLFDTAVRATVEAA